MEFRIQDYPVSFYLEQLRAAYRAKGQDVSLEPFSYNADFLPLNAAVSSVQNNTVDQDGDFHVLMKMQTTFVVGGAFVQFPNITVRELHNLGGRRFQDKDAALASEFGSGERARYCLVPYSLPAKTSWSTTLTNQEAATNFNVRLCWWGVKAMPRPLR